MFCSNCGAIIKEGHVFCAECGQQIKVKKAPEEPVSVDNGAAYFMPAADLNLEPDAKAEQVAASEPVTKPEMVAEVEPVAKVEPAAASEPVAKAEPVAANEPIAAAAPVVTQAKPAKKPRSKVLFALLIFLEVGLLFACGYGIYRFAKEKTGAATSAQELEEQLNRQEQQDKKAKKEKKAQEEEEKQRQEQEKQLEAQREQSKEQLLLALDNAVNSVKNSKESESVEEAKKRLETFQGYKASYDQLTGMESNAYQAGKECLGLMERALISDVEYHRFSDDVDDLCTVLNVYIDMDPRDYYDEDDYLEDASEALYEIEDFYESVNCPAYVKEWWDQVGVQIDLLVEVGNRGAQSIYLEDVLRYYSFLTLRDHVTQKLIQKLYEYASISEHEEAYYSQILDDSMAIYGKIVEASGLPYENRQAYQYPDYDGELVIDYDTIDVIYPTLYNAIDFFAILNVGCVSGERDVNVEFEIPGLTQVLKQSCHVGEGMTTLYLKPPATTALTDLSTVKDGQMRIVISDKNGQEIKSHSVPVKIMSQYDFQWYSDEFGYVSNNNILCFMTPEATAITELKREAINEISDMTSGEMDSFPGYQIGFPTDEDHVYVNTYLQAAGVMCALSDLNVRYNMDVFSSNRDAQHIMLPEQVLQYKSGLCIETALVVASALQSAGLHTYILLPDGHAQVAVEAWNGWGEYFLIETTSLPNDKSTFIQYGSMLLNDDYNGNGLSYLNQGFPIVYLSDSNWEKYIQNENVMVIDCSDSSLLGSTPFVH